MDEDSCDFNEETNDSATFEQFMNIQQEEEEEIEENCKLSRLWIWLIYLNKSKQQLTQ